MGCFELRTATDEDWVGIADGFARTTGRDASRIRQHVAYAFRDNPHGSSSILAAAPDGLVIAHMGVTHVPMLVKNEPLLFGRFHSCFIDPAYRTAGVHSLFVALDEQFRETFETRERLAAVFGQWDEADWWHLRRARGHGVVATSIDLRRPADRRLPGGGGDGTVVTQGGDSLGLSEAQGGTSLEVGSCGVRHGAGFDAWRAAVPGRSDRLWQAWRDGGRTGMAITRDADGVRLIVDWAVESEDTESARGLLHTILADARLPVHTRFWTSDVFTLLRFQEAGFEVLAGPEIYLSVRPVEPHVHQQWLSETWHVTLADAGLRPMPRLTVGEPGVYPPPPGTLGSRQGGSE